MHTLDHTSQPSFPIGVARGVVKQEEFGQPQESSLPGLPSTGHGNHGDSYGSHGDGQGRQGDGFDEHIFYNHQVVGQDEEERNQQQLLGSPLRLVQPLPQLHPPQRQPQESQQGHTLKQLEILYQARGRQVEELTHQLLAVKEEGGRHVRILREKMVMEKCSKETTPILKTLLLSHIPFTCTRNGLTVPLQNRIIQHAVPSFFVM